MKPVPDSAFTAEEFGKYTHHHVVSDVFEGSPQDVHKAFLKRVWWDGGFHWLLDFKPIAQSLVVKASDDVAGKGCTRGVMFGFIHEHIFDAQLGKYIKYTLKEMSFMKIFLAAHNGMISFYEAGPGHTRIVWEVLYTPVTPVGNAVFHGFMLIFLMFFSELKGYCAKKKSRGIIANGLILLLICYLAFMVSRILTIPKAPTYPGTDYMKFLAQHRKSTSFLDDTLKKHTYLVIGGTGFTGSAIVEELRARGAKLVKIMGRSLPPSVEYPYGPGKEHRYPLPGVVYIKGDVTDPDKLAEAMKGTDVVFHTAASYGFPSFSSQRGGKETEAINYQGMQNIYAAAKAAGVQQIIYTASADTIFSARDNIYANETVPFAYLGITNQTHADGPLAVGDHYARTKIMAERWLLEHDNKDYIRTLSLRPNGIYGPGEFSAFPKAINPGYILGMVPFYFDLSQRTDWSCVYSLAYSHLLATHKLYTDPYAVGGKAYFITDDEETNNAAWGIFKPSVEAAGASVKYWLRIPPVLVPKFGWGLELMYGFLKDYFRVEMPMLLSYKEGFKAITSHTHDNSRARKELGYEPAMSTAQCSAYTAEEIKRRYGFK